MLINDQLGILVNILQLSKELYFIAIAGKASDYHNHWKEVKHAYKPILVSALKSDENYDVVCRKKQSNHVNAHYAVDFYDQILELSYGQLLVFWITGIWKGVGQYTTTNHFLLLY